MALRLEELTQSTRPFYARGSRVVRCEGCLLPENACLCDLKPMASAKSAVAFLMYKGECYKPSNTGRLIADVAEENYAWTWSRTNPPQALLNMIDNPRYQPIVIFPHDYVKENLRISTVPQNEKTPLFIFLDGTWREARKMFTKSPYLHALPVLGITPTQDSDYLLREAAHDYQLCTAEVGIEVLKMAGDNQAAEDLNTYFIQFRQHYLRGKSHLTEKQQRIAQIAE